MKFKYFKSDDDCTHAAVYGRLSFIVADNGLHLGTIHDEKAFLENMVESNDQAFELALTTLKLDTLYSQITGLYKGLTMVSMVEQPLPVEN